MRRLCLALGSVAVLTSCDKSAFPPNKPANPDDKYAERDHGFPAPTTVAELRGRLNGEEGFGIEGLAREWKTVRPLCLEILQDKSDETGSMAYVHMTRMFSLVAHVRDTDDVFVQIALERLAHPNDRVRSAAVYCLAAIGNERHAAPVAILLLDQVATVRSEAAKTLATIGGKSEVLVFDMLLKNTEVYHHKGGERILWDFDVRRFKQYKAELEARLKKEAEAKEKK